MYLIARYFLNLALHPSLKPSLKFLTDNVETDHDFEEEYFALLAQYHNNKDLEANKPINNDPEF